MKKEKVGLTRAAGFLGAAAFIAIGAGLTQAQMQPSDEMKMDKMKMMDNWSPAAKKAAEGMMKVHGAPDEMTKSMAVWHNEGPWKRIIASNTTTIHNFPAPHPDSVEQFVSYKVPWNMHDEIARFDGSVNIDRTRGELSARCDAETHNILALNLSHDIITGKRSVQGARDFYARAIKIEKTQKKLHHYMLRLNFTPHSPERAADAGKIAPLLQPMVREMRRMKNM